jgi:hypothetical protein
MRWDQAHGGRNVAAVVSGGHSGCCRIAETTTGCSCAAADIAADEEKDCEEVATVDHHAIEPAGERTEGPLGFSEALLVVLQNRHHIRQIPILDIAYQIAGSAAVDAHKDQERVQSWSVDHEKTDQWQNAGDQVEVQRALSIGRGMNYPVMDHCARSQGLGRNPDRRNGPSFGH